MAEAARILAQPSAYNLPMSHITRIFYLLTAFLAALPVTTPAAEQTLELEDGHEIVINVLPGDGQRLLLWLPSEFGLSPRQKPTTRALAELGIEVWIPDLHSTWFIPPGRYSLNEVDPGAIAALLRKALGSGKQVYLMSSGRVAALALQAVRRLQTGNTPTEKLRGLIAISPRLYVRTPQGGEAAQYLPIASASNIPLYLLQPAETSAIWRIGEVMAQLEKGGSPVYLHRLQGVGDGFNLRADFSPAEDKATQHLPATVLQAMQMLDPLGGTPQQAAKMRGEEMTPEAARGADLLKPYPGSRQAPPLTLTTLDGRRVDLQSLSGKVVMVNFWATWCPPCVKEIPSLQRLYAATRGRGLEILAVDVGESEAEMRRFLADKPVDFPVLMDSDASALRTWGVYAFPTTLVLDRGHRIRYAVFGAFDWDASEVLKTLEPLLEQND